MRHLGVLGVGNWRIRTLASEVVYVVRLEDGEKQDIRQELKSGQRLACRPQYRRQRLAMKHRGAGSVVE
ncbi:hypothetical protein CPLU01_02081 [Colletotrichum plurivorum]|uniref:Uncharacterized protein n=1 Tax=Colletotrichum plurivorum TaxID=2175906 RepID=A0A8H6KWM8_9PEZI|nr:hypothetical protein CPLU01_02081 [Colletotrichum plurivorum]